jgi:Fe2+ transport system protein B
MELLLNNDLAAIFQEWTKGCPVPLASGHRVISGHTKTRQKGQTRLIALLDGVQIMTFLIFLTFYIPCVSTFAVMLKTIGRGNAFLSISISVGVALVVSGVLRAVLEAGRYFTG